MSKDLSLVWVEIGRGIPRHLKRNIHLHASLFPDLGQFLISDSPKAEKMLDFCEVIHPSDLPQVQERIVSLESRTSRDTIQKSFWNHTTSRFFALNGFLSLGISKNLIHLESDCVLLSADPISNLLSDTTWKVAYPMQARNIGCASILIAQGETALHEFTEFIDANWNIPDQDDMKLLGEYSERNFVKILNVSPGDHWIFDSQTYGRYLLGTEARNLRWPFSARGSVDYREGAINPSQFEFILIQGETFPQITVKYEDKTSNLANLHIHSKRVPGSLKGLKRLIESEVPPGKNWFWFKGRLDTNVLLERLISWILRRVSRSRKDFRIR